MSIHKWHFFSFYVIIFNFILHFTLTHPRGDTPWTWVGGDPFPRHWAFPGHGCTTDRAAAPFVNENLLAFERGSQFLTSDVPEQGLLPPPHLPPRRL